MISAILRWTRLAASVAAREPSDADSDGVRYAYKASLAGAAHRFELTDDGLSWHVGGRSGLWPYDGITAIRLSYRPVSMQSHRFRADIEGPGRRRAVVLSTTWRSAALIAPQDQSYRAFITQLHARMNRAASRAQLAGGLRPHVYVVAAVASLLALMAIMALFIQAIATGEWAGAMFLAGFAALFVWQIGGLLGRNRPRPYTFDNLPGALLP